MTVGWTVIDVSKNVRHFFKGSNASVCGKWQILDPKWSPDLVPDNDPRNCRKCRNILRRKR